jgi:hypothetical protein
VSVVDLTLLSLCLGLGGFICWCIFDHGLYLRSYMFCSAETAEIFYIYAC